MLGLKLHTKGAQQLGSTVELHGFDGGYLGLAAVEGERVNVCALVQSSALRRVGKDSQRLADEVMAANPSLALRLKQLQLDWSQALAVANLQFGPAPHTGRLCVGDSAGAIAPLCGDGISMALRASQLAAPLADRYLDGAITGASMLDSYRRQWRREFGLRLRLGNQLQALLLSDVGGTLALTVLRRLPALGRWAIARTRG
jgi:flavin-dependent dehydrogenase